MARAVQRREVLDDDVAEDPEAVNDVPMDQWAPAEIVDHMQYVADFATRLQGSGEYVDGQALSPEGTFVR